MVVRLDLLGEVTARADGRVLDLGPARQRCVLAALAVDAGRVVPAERLVERVWGADAPLRERATLQSYVSRLRRALVAAGGGIALRAGGYALVLGEVGEAVDLHRFRALRLRARGAGTADRVALLAEALDLWRGEPLTGLTGEWAAAERERLRWERLDAEHDLADARLSAGEGEELVAELSARVGEHPLDERVAAQHLLALYRAGRAADALEHYRLLRDRLVEEVGADPGEALQDLHRRILAADPALMPGTGTAVRAGPGSVGPVVAEDGAEASSTAWTRPWAARRARW